MPFSSKRSLPALACPAALLLCELVSRSWAEAGIGDDWSYVYTARLLAETGHIHYVGWAAAIVGWQFYLGAACIKLFGFSYTAARLPTLLIGLLTAYLMQRTLVQLGITEGNAVLGTLTFVLSPLFLPLTATMMTDVPAFFSMLACLYGCVRALRASRDRDAVLWLCFAVAVNAICGTSRQNAWLGILVLVPSALWLLRSRRAILLYGGAATALGYFFVFVTLHWFNAQPFALPEPVSLSFLNTWALKRVGVRYAQSLMEIGWLVLPMGLPFLAAVRRYNLRSLAGMAALVAASWGILYYLGKKEALVSLLYPFNGDLVGPHAMFEYNLMVASRPTVLGPNLVLALSVITMAVLVCVGTMVLVVRPASMEGQPAGPFSWPQIALLLGPFGCAYVLLLSPRAVYFIFDRYLFAPIFLALACLLLYSQQRLRDRVPIVAYAAVGAIAFYGIVTTHNLFAFNRARAVLVNEVLGGGVPANHADLGFDIDGLTEITSSGYVNEPHIVHPAGAYHEIREPQPNGCHEAGYGFFPHLAAQYGISFDQNVCDGPAPFAPVSYSTWPLRRPTLLYVVKYPPPWRPENDYEVGKAPAR